MTVIDTHVLNRRGKGVCSPADALTVVLGPSQPSSDYADQYLSATAESGEP